MARDLFTAALAQRVDQGTIAADAADRPYTATNATNDCKVVISGKEYLDFFNSGAGARTVTIDSIKDPIYGRLGSVTAYSIGAGEYAMFGPFSQDAWQQTSGGDAGFMTFEAEHAEVKCRVIKFP